MTSALPPSEPRERTISTRSREAAAPKNRPPSIQVPLPDALAPSARPQGRRPSNAASTVSQAPSVSSQAPPSRPLPLNNSVSRDSQHSRDPREASMVSDYPTRSSRAASPTPAAPSRLQPARTETSRTEANVTNRRDQNVRISYFDPSNQALVDRVLTSATDSQIGVDGEEEQALATLTNVEEMIEGYEWASDDVIGRKSNKGAIDLIEARLLDELTALEKVCGYTILSKALAHLLGRPMSTRSSRQTTALLWL